MHELLETAERAARLGGEVLRSWAGRFTSREKSPANLVTEADLASERAIYEFIRERFPDHRFLGEEGLNQDAGDSPVRWIIDPLDGTSNYVHGFPYYAVSIGVEYQRALVAGAIYDPSRDEMFLAAAGDGATLNGQPIHVSLRDDLSTALCMASLPVKTTRDHPAVQSFLRVLEAAQHVQRTGSAALNLAAVAAGRVEAFWSTSLKSWDMAAGVVLVREAGGTVTRTAGGPFVIDDPDLLASNGTRLHNGLSELLNPPTGGNANRHP
ncbi:MAG: inositol monophosphatase [Planctomycetaceae bacterium]